MAKSIVASQSNKFIDGGLFPFEIERVMVNPEIKAIIIRKINKIIAMKMTLARLRSQEILANPSP